MMDLGTRLDSPPPPPRFRRPWSPDLLDSSNSSRYNRRREPSDVSIEALDLADYAMSLPRRANRPYDNQDNFMPNDPYPPSPRGIGLFVQSRDSLHPPSLASPGGTLSTTTSAPRSPRDRPRSLPPRSHDPHTSSQRSAPRIANYDSYLSDGPYSHQDHETEIDVGRFPSFARHWYSNHRTTARSPPGAYHSVPNTDSISPFDPAYPTHKHDSHNSFQKQPFYGFDYPSLPSSHDSHSRNVLPWVNERQDPLAEQLHPDVKKERIRMLEREFAGKDVGKGLDDDENMVGSADLRGRLITQGPKKRLATRWFQALLSLGAAVSLIYIALAIKPRKQPPPQGTIPFYVLYVLSILTFLLVTYLFLIFPYCCLGRGKDSKFTGPLGPEGLAVLPIQHLPGGSKHKGSEGKKKNKKGRPGGSGDVQVNLIVDPNLFGGGRRGRDEEEEEYDEEHSSRLGTSSGRSGGSNGRRPRGPKRRSVFEGLALEARWKEARKRSKWAMTVDVVCFILWGAEFVIILVGQKCPPGGFDRWCDGYNLATAFACLTCLLFGFSLFFDIKDLHGSRISPRTRT